MASKKKVDDLSAEIEEVSQENEIIEPIYSGEQVFRSDLYKLLVETRLHNVAWTGEPDYQELEHCHFFHTFDSKGREQTCCVSTGQHHHKMKVTKVKGGVPKVECISGPMCWTKKKVRGRWTKVEIPFNEDDQHTHEVKYIRSHKVVMRKTNAEAVNLVTLAATKEAPVSGVIG
jgi:hypothetical protein